MCWEQKREQLFIGGLSHFDSCAISFDPKSIKNGAANLQVCKTPFHRLKATDYPAVCGHCHINVEINNKSELKVTELCARWMFAVESRFSPHSWVQWIILKSVSSFLASYSVWCPYVIATALLNGVQHPGLFLYAKSFFSTFQSLSCLVAHSQKSTA